MKIRSIAVNQFMKYSEPTQLTGLKDGLNLVVGPNEMGKSTLLCALRAAFFDRYSSKARRIRELQHHRNQAAPVVQVRFELDDGEYTVTKRFLKRNYARLICPNSRIAEGDAVEEELNRLLRADDSSYSIKATDAPGMWGVLWVEQGKSFIAPELTRGARSNFHQALESEVGSVLGGRRGQELPRRFESDLNEIVTPKTKKPKGQYKIISEKIDALKNDIQELQARRKEFSEDLYDLELNQRKLSELDKGDEDVHDEKKLEKAREERINLEKHGEKRNRVIAECKRLESVLKLLEADKNNFKQLANSIEEESQHAIEFENKLSKLQATHSVNEINLRELQKRVLLSRAGIDQATEIHRRAKLIFEAVQKKQEISRLNSILQAAEKSENRYQEDRRAASEILVTDDVIARIRTADKNFEVAKSTLAASATAVAFHLNEGCADQVKVDGRFLQSERSSIEAVRQTVVTVTGIGEISIKPAIQNAETILVKEKEARKNLEWELKRSHVESLQQAEQVFLRRKTLLESARIAREELVRVLADSEPPFQSFQDLEIHIHELNTTLETMKKNLKMDNLPSSADARNAAERAEEETELKRRQYGKVQNKLNGHQNRMNELRNEITRIETQNKQHRNLLEQHKTLLKELEKKTPLNIVQKQIKNSKEEHSYHKNVLLNLDLEHGPSSLDTLIQRIDRIKRRIKLRQSQKQDLRESITRLTTQLETKEARGLHEKLAETERSLNLVQAKKRACDRNVQVLELLLSTLRNTEQQAKQKFMQPVLNRVHPYLGHLFPNSEIKIDENLNIMDIVRDDEQEKYDRLSMGTQEQIAVLIRLAFAELLADKGIPAAVVLDDALVYSDDRRMDLMFDILTEAEKNPNYCTHLPRKSFSRSYRFSFVT